MQQILPPRQSECLPCFSSKYMGGHSDLIAGCVSTRTVPQWRRLKKMQAALGSCLVVWLLLMFLLSLLLLSCVAVIVVAVAAFVKLLGCVVVVVVVDVDV